MVSRNRNLTVYHNRSMTDIARCSWKGLSDPLYTRYHDEEWGVPIHDDIKLFEALILDGSQAGLSWLTILKKRENYRIAFDGFDPRKIEQYDNTKIIELLHNSGIVRNRMKIEAAITGATKCLEVIEEFGSFDKFIWSFVNGRPIVNHWESQDKVPASTEESDAMSKELRARGFKFAGSTICYAFMQGVGMVNDHVTGCFRHDQIK